MTSSFVYDPSIISDKEFVKFIIGGEDWVIEKEEWERAESEGRTRPVIYGERLILVDDETFDELRKLESWLKINLN